MALVDVDKWKNRYARLSARTLALWRYASDGVWRDTRNFWWINVTKTLNISVRSFLDSDLQSKACAMTYRTILAIVPALALLFALGRGFGLQTVLEDELYSSFPAQKEAIKQALQFADSYLDTSGEGLFLGVGIAFLLWTLISLVSSVEDTFNVLWGIKNSRSLWRKITDYTAMLLILPVLMICGSGLTIFMSSSLQAIFIFPFMTPVIHMILDGASWLFTWLFFAAVFILIPNTKVKKGNAIIAGVIAGTGFRILQWLFVTGQLYVTRYNAIYGSFAFLPLLLIWVQLTWVITLSGSLLCYASQSIVQFSFQSDINNISISYRQKVAVGLAAVVVRSFTSSRKAPTAMYLSKAYEIPSKLVSEVVEILVETGILVRVIIDEKAEIYGLQPAINPDELTLRYVLNKLENRGVDNFIDNFDENFKSINELADKIIAQVDKVTDDVRLEDIDIMSENKAMQIVERKNHIHSQNTCKKFKAFIAEIERADIKARENKPENQKQTITPSRNHQTSINKIKQNENEKSNRNN